MAAVTSVGVGLAFLSFVPGMLVINPFLPEGLMYMGASAMPEALDPEALHAHLSLRAAREVHPFLQRGQSESTLDPLHGRRPARRREERRRTG